MYGRIDVFGRTAVSIGRRGRTKLVPAGWQAWNRDPRMERKMARLPGSGSFYWPTLRDAYRAATVILRGDVEAVRVETIGGREVAYLRKGAIA